MPRLLGRHRSRLGGLMVQIELAADRPQPELAAQDSADALAIRRYLSASRSTATWRRYATMQRQWRRYCDGHGWQGGATPERVSAWLAHLADSGRSWSTIQVAAAALRTFSSEDAAVLDHPGVRATLAGIARVVGKAPKRQARGLSIDEMRQILARIGGGSLAEARDRALLAVWWLSACRSSEMANLNLADLDWRPQGVALHLRRSKTDQDGEGRQVAIPGGPATEALRTWLERLADHGRRDGAVWCALDGGGGRLSAPALVEILRRRAATAGIADVSGHSLRRGHVTAAALLGVPMPVIAQQTGHRSLDTVLRYYEAARLFDHTSARGLL